MLHMHIKHDDDVMALTVLSSQSFPFIPQKLQTA